MAIRCRQGSPEVSEDITSDDPKRPREAETRGPPITTKYAMGTRAEAMTAGNLLIFLSVYMASAIVQPRMPELPFASPKEIPEYKEEAMPKIEIAMTKSFEPTKSGTCNITNMNTEANGEPQNLFWTYGKY